MVLPVVAGCLLDHLETHVVAVGLEDEDLGGHAESLPDGRHRMVVVVQHALDEHEVERVVGPGQPVAVADDEVQPGIGPAPGGDADGGGGRVEADHAPG